MKKIAFILPPYLPFPPVRGGAVESLLELFITENEKAGRYEITVFSIYDPQAEACAKGYKHTKVVYFNIKEISHKKEKICNLIQKFLQLRLNILDDYNYKIIKYLESNSMPDLCIAEGGYYRAFTNISKVVGRDKMVFHIHAVSTPRFNANRIFKSFIFVSKCSKEQWEKRTACEGYVLLNAADEEKFNPQFFTQRNVSLREKLGICEEDIMVLFCGRLVEGKGVLELLKAIKATENKRIKLVVVGSSNFEGADITPYQKELLSLIDDQTIFTGYVKNSELPVYYRAANLVVSPSTFIEGAPLVNVEAMMCGKAVLTTSQGGIPEYANSEGVVMIDYHNDREQLTKDLSKAISELSSNVKQLEKMGQSNSKYAQKFEKHKYFENYSEIINTIIEGRKS